MKCNGQVAIVAVLVAMLGAPTMASGPQGVGGGYRHDGGIGTNDGPIIDGTYACDRLEQYVGLGLVTGEIDPHYSDNQFSLDSAVCWRP